MESQKSISENEVIFWVNDVELQNIFSGKYWNEEEIEKKKPYYILEDNKNNRKVALLRYLARETTLCNEYRTVIKFAKFLNLNVRGIGLDIAAGVGWTSALLSRIEGVEIIYALDISKHRLIKLAPEIFNIFKTRSEKIERVIGSFYNIKLPDHSVDFCFVSQAFHHSSDCRLLLHEIRRVLKPKGFILLIGEKPITIIAYIKEYLKNIVKIILPNCLFKSSSKPIFKLFPKYRDFFPIDTECGDHYYRLKEYYDIFQSCGLRLYKKRGSGFIVFLATKD